MPHKDAGYTSAVVTLDQSLPKAIPIGPGPYTSRHDKARVGPGPFSHIALFLPGRRRMLPSARRLHVPIAIFKEARNGKETSTSCDGKGRATWLGNMSEPPPRMRDSRLDTAATASFTLRGGRKSPLCTTIRGSDSTQ